MTNKDVWLKRGLIAFSVIVFLFVFWSLLNPKICTEKEPWSVGNEIVGASGYRCLVYGERRFLFSRSD